MSALFDPVRCCNTTAQTAANSFKPFTCSANLRWRRTGRGTFSAEPNSAHSATPPSARPTSRHRCWNSRGEAHRSPPDSKTATSVTAICGDSSSSSSTATATADTTAATAARHHCSPPALVFLGLAGEWRLHRRIDSANESGVSGDVYGTARFDPIARSARTAAQPSPEALARSVAVPASATSAASAASAASIGPVATAVVPAPDDYHYREQGEFRTDAGGHFRVRREYVYSYSPETDRLDVHFAASGGARDYHFHTLIFKPGGGVGGGDVASAAEATLDSSGGSDRGGSPTRDGNSGPTAATAGEAVAGSSGSRDGGGGDQGDAGAQRWWIAASGDHLCDRDVHALSYRFWFRGTRLESFEVSCRVEGPDDADTVIGYITTAVYSRAEVFVAR